jgi:hypothetical protein
MSVWEYCKLVGSDVEGQDGFLCFYKPTAIQTFPLKPQAWEQAIARLGQEGWELVTVENSTFFFKRPVSANLK